MNRTVATRSNEHSVLEERTGAERDRLDHPVTDEQNEELLPRQEEIGDKPVVKYRRSRLGAVKVHHKRQALQDMARPLKQWLYKHRDNPYPTKTEKVLLALGSRMTLVQVSNWFANARRRLKNAVRQPDLSWALRIKLYNKYIQGNAERLSISSDDSNSDDDESPLQTPTSQSELSRPSAESAVQPECRPDPAYSDHCVSPPSKYKSSLLNRYLNDTLRHVMATADDATGSRRRNHSGSFSSNECDDDLLSPSSSEGEANFVYHTDTMDYTSSKRDSDVKRERTQWKEEEASWREEEASWRETHAALALTSLSRGRSLATGPSGTTSHIVQKSSHISEVKTVSVAPP
ncbi:homeobox protein Mohawk-like isoform X2 [Esox lucius]|uniref:Homeobox domain-containing protein n=1 Tax=Esox lucius TaxID=8010 RepID=A0AAY5L666_ESOLU|nr:homeobox protein Mohawk-like isoform X2 [Esox lucius]